MNLNHGKLAENDSIEAGKIKLPKFYDFSDTNNLCYVTCLLDGREKCNVLKVNLRHSS
jgi:hypothetical protein